ncbi:hypothetical protein GURASL_38560 [Geotalea uraniireducens]|uniref:HEAT repeat domain-containing protein n=1 Tax=Geotalea uraniireducens TaxID=351604 RepID=A0ABM8EQZ4_9BACT|nr:HEAT repeat domain-containing protein [Geotalea uraniireducens]BDV44933.1 hypothetical protein GURASL_38560 [Geotalea uraniireducens]
MEQRHRKIDTSLRERHNILSLLERLRKENITVDEMEEIGARLQKAGRRALSPLVRRLWREKNGDIISRYTYLLDFFEDDSWLDQLIKITLTRKDLEEEGKSVLLSALEGYGVDVSAPPFARLLDEVGGPLQLIVPRLLDKGERGLVMFMEDFVSYTPDAQRALVRELAQVDDPRVLDIFAVLLGFDEPETQREAVEMLGRIRAPRAVTLLKSYLGTASGELRGAAERSLRRLSFLGLDITVEPEPLLAFCATYASPPDASGISCLFVARWTGPDRLDTLFLELHETTGMREAWGWSGVTPEEYRKIVTDNNVDDSLVQVEPAYLVALVCDAMHRSFGNGFYMPPEFYVRQRLFAGLELVPAPYEPAFADFAPEASVTPQRIAEGMELFGDYFFDGWFIFNEQVRLLSGELERLGDEPFAGRDGAVVEQFLEEWCRDQVAPQLEQLVRRLRLTAALMDEAERDRQLIELTLVAAHSIAQGMVPLHRHPFLRRWLLELIDMVRDARAEGYEFPPPRREADDDGGWV